MKKLQLGVVGCGDIAGYMGLASRLVPKVSLSACCDADAARAGSFARRHRIRQVFTDYAQLLSQAQLDAVYLAVPHDLHYPMIRAALEADLPVLVEKPATRTLEEGNRLAEIIRDRKVGVNYQYRYDRGCYALARAVQTGALGQVHSIRINLPWRRDRTYFEASPWHKTIAQAGGGTLLTQGSHFLDIALWALGEEIVSAEGYLATPGFDVEVETLANAMLETSSGTVISITSSMVAPREGPVTIEAYGERGTAFYHDRPFPSVKFNGIKLRPERPPERGFHALQRSLAGFANWVLVGKPYLTPLHEALPVLAAVEAVYHASRRITCKQNQKN